MRFLTAISLRCPEYLEHVSIQFWKRIWTQEEDIVEDESLRSAARNAKMSADNIEKCLKEMDGPAVKEALKKNTQEALSYGVHI